MLESRLPPPATPAAPDPVERITATLAAGDVNGFVAALRETLANDLRPTEPAAPPVDQAALLRQVAQVVQIEREINTIRDSAVRDHAHLAPLRESIIEPRVAALVDQAQRDGRIKSDADVPIAYRAAVDVAIREANELYTRIRGTGQNAPNVVRTDVVSASPGSNVAERDAAPVGTQPDWGANGDPASTRAALEARRAQRFARKEPITSFTRRVA